MLGKRTSPPRAARASAASAPREPRRPRAVSIVVDGREERTEKREQRTLSREERIFEQSKVPSASLFSFFFFFRFPPSSAAPLPLLLATFSFSLARLFILCRRERAHNQTHIRLVVLASASPVSRPSTAPARAEKSKAHELRRRERESNQTLSSSVFPCCWRLHLFFFSFFFHVLRACCLAHLSQHQ